MEIKRIYLDIYILEETKNKTIKPTKQYNQCNICAISLFKGKCVVSTHSLHTETCVYEYYEYIHVCMNVYIHTAYVYLYTHLKIVYLYSVLLGIHYSFSHLTLYYFKVCKTCIYL